MKYLTTQLNMVCTPEEKSRLVAMALRAKCSQAEIVRRALDREFQRTVRIAVAEAEAATPVDKTWVKLLLDYCNFH